MSEKIFKLRYVCGKNWDDISKEMGISATDCYELYAKIVDKKHIALAREWTRLPKYKQELAYA